MYAELPAELLRGRYVVLIALAFPLVGVYMLGKSLVAFLRERKFRNLRLTLSSVPAVAGGQLKGQIQAGYLLPSGQPVDLSLSCVSSYLSKNDKETRWQRVLWQDRKTVTTTSGGLESYVPVDFSVPYDAPETDSRDPDNEILWRVTAAASLPGLDFRDNFVVPVFKTNASDPTLNIEKVQIESAARLRGAKPDEAKITAAPAATGGVRFYLAPGRNKGAAAMITFFGLLCLGSGLFFGIGLGRGFSWFVGAIPLVIFGGFGLLLLAIAFTQWFAATSVELINRELHIRTTCVGFSNTRVVRASDIQKLELKSNMQSGDHVWYDLKVHLKAGRPITAGSDMEQEEGEWFLGEVKRDLGI